jgi:hypothetical protein
MRRLVGIVFLALIALLGYLFFTLPQVPEKVTYGVSFSTLNARELELDWRAVYNAVLEEFGARELRIPAYWPELEPAKDQYNWSALDYQLSLARSYDANVVLAVGRRLPRWPECHVPEWAKKLSWEEQKEEIREYIEAVVERYKDNEAIQYWQVENEPFLSVFASDHCGELDKDFLDEEIALVRSLDERPILVTDSGNLGKWLPAYKRGDAFGTSMYIYFWNPELGQFKTKLPVAFYRLKHRLAEALYGKKPAFLIELSLEPWLVQPTKDIPLETQLERMNIDKFQEIIAYAGGSSFEMQYLWGAEWWYYLKEKHAHPEFWNTAKSLFNSGSR